MEDKYIHIIHRVLSLLDVLEEGLYYTQNKVIELQYEEAFMLLMDVTEGIESIKKAIKPMKLEILEKGIDELFLNLESYITGAVLNYELSRQSALEKLIEKFLFPSFVLLKEEIQRCFLPYIVS